MVIALCGVSNLMLYSEGVEFKQALAPCHSWAASKGMVPKHDKVMIRCCVSKMEGPWWLHCALFCVLLEDMTRMCPGAGEETMMDLGHSSFVGCLTSIHRVLEVK